VTPCQRHVDDRDQGFCVTPAANERRNDPHAGMMSTKRALSNTRSIHAGPDPSHVSLTAGWMRQLGVVAR
jgi:hypothetical protein